MAFYYNYIGMKLKSKPLLRDFVLLAVNEPVIFDGMVNCV